MIRMPDAFQPCSLELLEKLDKEDGWMAQPRVKGSRHVLWGGDFGWISQRVASASRPGEVPKQALALAPPRPLYSGVDVMVGEDNIMYVADLLMAEVPCGDDEPYSSRLWPQYLSGFPFHARYELLKAALEFRQTETVKLLPVYRSPGLLDRFAEVLTLPYADGLVLRHACSHLVGAWLKSVENVAYYSVRCAEVGHGQ